MKEKTVSRSKAARHPATGPRSKTASWVNRQREDDEAIGEILFTLKRFMATVRHDLNVLPLNTAISLLQCALEDEKYPKETRSILHHHLRRALLTRYSFFGRVQDLEKCFPREEGTCIVVTKGTTGRDIEKVDQVQTSIELIEECRQCVDTATLDDIIWVAEESLELYTEGKEVLRQAEFLILLGNALVMRYLNCLGDLELAYAANKFREAEYLCRGNIPLSYISLTALAHIEWLRATECGYNGGTMEVGEYMEKALAIDKEGDRLFQIGSKMKKEATEISQLHEAITYLKAALRCRMPHHPQRSPTMISLANALSTLFDWGGDVKNLEEGIILNMEGLRTTSIHYPDHALWLNNLANALSTRFKQKGAFQDLEECIQLHRKALDLLPPPHPHRSTSLNNLAGALTVCFEQKGAFQDLEECIQLHREAQDLFPHPHPLRSGSLNNLAAALSTRFKQKGLSQDLEECIQLHREALDLRPPPHPHRSTSLNNLANALSARFKQKGAFQDLEECIELHRQALDLFPPPHPLRSGSLNNLAAALLTRFEQKGAFHDLEECIQLYREALDILAPPHPDRSMTLNNLAGALSTCFKQKGAFRDLEECIQLHREALDLQLPPHPGRSGSLNNLAIALSTRFEQKRAFPDLEECIQLHRQALDLRPPPHPHRSSSLNNLANALSTRFEQKGVYQDLEQCIRLHREALDLRPLPHPDRLSSFNNLANAHAVWHDRSKEPEQLEQALRFYDLASRYETGSLLNRLTSAKFMAALARQHHPTASLNAYLYALELLPLLASIDLTLKERRDVLEHSRELVGDATQCAINQNEFETAVVCLSTGRSIFWSQALQLRTSVEELAAIDPILAEEYLNVSRQLEQASHGLSDHLHTSLEFDTKSENPNPTTFKSLSKLADQRRQTIEEIRGIPGFEGFLLPPTFASLRRAADTGPVVFLNTSKFGCDALIMHESGSVEHIALPDIKLLHLEALKVMIYNSLTGGLRSIDDFKPQIQTAIDALKSSLFRGLVRKRPSDSYNDPLQIVLGITWLCVVQPVVKALALQRTHSPRRIWWCPSGAFTSLPIHAAGIYSDDHEPVDCLFHYAVSSYCTSPQDLIHSQPEIPTAFKMTAIIEPEAFGGNSLPATLNELDNIYRHLSDNDQLIAHLGLQSAPNEIEVVLPDIQQSSIVHFGCHGLQNLDDPLESFLLLSGGKLTMSRMIKDCQISNSTALAYLSACETAKGDKDRPDESLNLVATMMFAGFRSVVGTMWSIYDSDAPVVADVFYGHLFRNGKSAPPDVRDSAYALHLATAKLREQGRGFRSWVPYVHYGI